MRRADTSTESLWIALSADERMVLNPGWALGPWDPKFFAKRLGFRSGQALEDEADRLTTALHTHEPMTYRDWCKAIDIISALMSPRDLEWQTVNGLDYLETATALTSIMRKVDLAFGGTRINPAIGPDQKRRE